MTVPMSSAEAWKLAEALPILREGADQLVADGIAAMERGDEIDQEELFAERRAKYG